MDEASQQAAIERVIRLMRIPAASGSEHAVAAVIRDELLQAGADPAAIWFDDAHQRIGSGSCGNLFYRIGNSSQQPARLFSAHMDTVPICVGCVPELREGQVMSADPETGLGADDRSGCAVVLSAALESLSRPPSHPLIFAWFVQEEVGLKGARHLDAKGLGEIAMAFNFDGGTPEKLTIGATGGERMRIEVRGRASHAGLAPEEGISALVIAARAIAELADRGWLGRVEKDEGAGTSNVGIIEGGGATNVVTPHVTVRAEARSHDSGMRRRIVEQFEEAFRRAAQSLRNTHGDCGSVEFHSNVDYDSFKLGEDDAGVAAARRAVQQAGRQPILNISGGGVDANWLYKHGIPAVTLGCGQRNVHTTSETLDVADYLTACEIALWLTRAEA